jgi:hypothetical protein
MDKKVKNLIQFMEEEPRAKWGFYIYTGDYQFDLKSRIFFIPAWMIC